MTKEKFLKKFNKEQLNTYPFRLELDVFTEFGGAVGCVFHEGRWVIYKAGERDGATIYAEFDNEEDAFDGFYERIKEMDYCNKRDGH